MNILEAQRAGFLIRRREEVGTRDILTKQDMREVYDFVKWWRLRSSQWNDSHSTAKRAAPKASATGLRMKTTRFRRVAKRLQLERQVIVKISDARRIHRQVIGRLFLGGVVFSGSGNEKPKDGMVCPFCSATKQVRVCGTLWRMPNRLKIRTN